MKLVFPVLLVLVVCATTNAQQSAQKKTQPSTQPAYKVTTLPVEAGDLAFEKGGHVNETLGGENGPSKFNCVGLSLKTLKVGDRDIPLKSTVVTQDCMIETSDYGNVGMAFDVNRGGYSILLTAKQETAFSRLIAAPASQNTKAK